jgi:protein-S-isoprenylcysteine O-methyltransferase Ste14
MTDATARHVLVAIYAGLRTLIALAFVIFTIDRAEPHRRSRDPLAFVACAIAMAAVLIVAQPGRATPPGLLAAGDLLAVVGCLWLLASVLTLGRCFGVLPEARGLVRRGPYRLVRHPVYLGEIVALAGLTVAAPGTWNLGVFAMFVVAQVTRTHLEERALTEAFPDYAGYAAETGRLVPLVGRRRADGLVPLRPRPLSRWN